MTPRRGLGFGRLAATRRGLRFPFRPTVYAAATSGMFLFTAACGGSYGIPLPGDADATEPSSTAPASLDESSGVPLASGSLEESLARLEALELLEVSGLYETRTQHQWIPYGGYWSESEVELTEAETADRLARFVEVAEAAVANAPDAPAPNGANDVDALCYPITADAYCLTRSMHADDLAALDALEIVHIDGMVRDDGEMSGQCYTSWDTVTADDCTRALHVRAVVEATADFADRNPPEEG